MYLLSYTTYTTSIYLYISYDIGNAMALEITSKCPVDVVLKYEKVYYPCILASKKRYVGRAYERQGQMEGHFDAKVSVLLLYCVYTCYIVYTSSIYSIILLLCVIHNYCYVYYLYNTHHIKYFASLLYDHRVSRQYVAINVP